MSQYVEACTKTFIAGGALPLHARVKLTAGKLALAGLADKEIGTTERQAFADGDAIPVRLRTAYGTSKMIAAKALTAGTTIRTAASGKVSDAAAVGSFIVGDVLDTATADGDIVEVLRNSHGDTAA